MIKGRSTGYPKVDDDMPFYAAVDCEPLLKEALILLTGGAAAFSIIGRTINARSCRDLADRIERFLETGVKE